MKNARVAYILAAAWGIAEATVFFFVPDVLLSRVALQDRRAAFIACAWATAGALAGGCLVWWIGATEPEPARAFFAQIPGISAAMIADVQQQLREYGAAAIFIGPTIGTPYKIYALEAAQAGTGLFIFALVSVPARIVRFVLVSWLAALLGRLLGAWLSMRTLYIAHAAVWISFYAWYLQFMAQRY